MSGAEKPHRSILITAGRLRSNGACEEGIRKAKRAGLIPARLSTDPEKNLPLAIRATRAEASGCNCADCTAGLDHLAGFGGYNMGASTWDFGAEPGVVAQMWAAFADSELSAAGK